MTTAHKKKSEIRGHLETDGGMRSHKKGRDSPMPLLQKT